MLLKLTAEALELLLQLLYLTLEYSDSFFERGAVFSRRRGLRFGRNIRRPAQQLHPSASRSASHQRLRLPRGQRLQTPLHFIQIAEIVHPLGPSPQFPDRLRATQHEHAQQRQLTAPEVEAFS